MNNVNIQDRNIHEQYFFFKFVYIVYIEHFLVSCVSYRFVFNSVSMRRRREIRLFELGFLHDQVRKTEALLTMKIPYIFMP